MPIDPDVALGAKVAPFTTSWDADDVILYHLGIGAGLNRPTEAAELAYTYEQRLAVLPSFAVVPAFQGLVLAASGQVPGLAVNRARQATAGGENKSDRRDARESVACRVVVREVAVMTVRHLAAPWSELVAPRIPATLVAARGEAEAIQIKNPPVSVTLGDAPVMIATFPARLISGTWLGLG